ncbi:hypothetical protein [Bacteriovorax sp. Seq25_V]|uniref:hypothetical protein n=1 Tax=Bacteriovorax sp. Seq25_V TaxID=1201288 RepID=UPI000389F05D|nr:hypothetical protein [Bacteriovorax sp. Seq25_V]EQC43680.1 hypothetical protein M900_1227 [Bacteriovorax sp. Seq25_V]
MSKDFESQQQYERLMAAKNAVEQRMYNSQAEAEIQVQIFPDKSVSPAKFVPNKSIPGTYRAHPTTIRAMRPEIFTGAHNELFADLEYVIECESCHSEYDLQFWKFCPYCEKSIPKDLPKSLNSRAL